MLTNEEKKNRRIGGSSIGKLLGLSKWGSPLDVYLELRGETPPEVMDPDEDSEDKDRGNYLEPGLREWAGKKLSTTFTKPAQLTLPEFDYATVNLDGVSADETSCLEIKAPRFGDGLGREGTDELPADWLTQGAWGVMIARRSGYPNMERCHFGVFIGGKLQLFKYEREINLENALLERAKEFVEKHVVPGVPPPLAFGDDEYFKKRFPRNEEPPVLYADLTANTKALVESYLEAYLEAKATEKKVDMLKAGVMETVGNRAGILFPPGHTAKRIDWKCNRPAMHAGTWKALAEELLSTLPQSERELLLQKHLPENGSRVFKPYFTK